MAEGGGAGVFLRRFFLLVSFLWDSMGVGGKRAEEEVRPILFPSGDGIEEELGAEGPFFDSLFPLASVSIGACNLLLFSLSIFAAQFDSLPPVFHSPAGGGQCALDPRSALYEKRGGGSGCGRRCMVDRQEGKIHGRRIGITQFFALV